jgi:hypothetical protein
LIDYDDDWQKNCSLRNETDIARQADAELFIYPEYRNATKNAALYLAIDGKNVTPIYLEDRAKYYFDACDQNNKTIEEFDKLVDPEYEGEVCDFEPFQAIGGLDVGPMAGMYGIDTRTWADNESHTYEFGSLFYCATAKFILTAKAPPTTAPVNSPTKSPTKAPTEAPTRERKCGLLGLGIFCPFAWLSWFFGLFN